MNNPYSWLEKSLQTIHQANWYRRVKTLEGKSGATLNLNGKSLRNFASNDYLGLAGDSRLINAAIAALETYGAGATGSRLLSGHRQLHRDLEIALARLKQTQDALVFSSGYLANLGTITALVNQKDLILADKYNHSSLKNGAKLSGATVLEYAHADVIHLQTLLEKHRPSYRRCLIITDTVFSMDGDLCPLPAILALGEEFNSMVLVDEAHATGVLGATGAGAVEHFHCTQKPLVQVGTLSKALGSLGGYVAGDAALIDFLRNRAPTWIYTTALTPADTAAALSALEILSQEPERRRQLWENVNFFKKNLTNKNLLPSESAIVCLEVTNAQVALDRAALLQAQGVFCPAIRPPTVPTSRLRFSFMATHTQGDIEDLLEVLGEFS
jgi:8-amino-7-oxononanoate synthase